MGGFPAHLLIRILIQFQIKFLYHHQQMIEYIGLNTFVFLPYLVSGKEVKLEWELHKWSFPFWLIIKSKSWLADRKAPKITFDVQIR